jgi:hypothetical protein
MTANASLFPAPYPIEDGWPHPRHGNCTRYARDVMDRLDTVHTLRSCAAQLRPFSYSSELDDICRRLSRRADHFERTINYIVFW